MKKVVEEVEYLLRKAEDKVWQNEGRTMTQLFWELGYCLKDVNDIKEASFVLERELSIDRRMFEQAYIFYQENPLKSKALEVAA